MLSDLRPNASSGNLSAGIETDSSIKAVIAFIKEHFNLFAEKNKGATDLNEKGLSQKLCIFLNRNVNQHPFFFHSDFMEDIESGTSPQVDIGTLSNSERISIADREYGENDSFFSIEAKRLPTPGTNREKEYVIGHNAPKGGIERFKKGIHGPKLKYGAIIGYVQENNFDHWFLTINSWIEELVVNGTDGVWAMDDKIQKVEFDSSSICVELFSEHSRHIKGKESDKIQLYHFWVNLL
jgi:hypothetical protein